MSKELQKTLAKFEKAKARYAKADAKLHAARIDRHEAILKAAYEGTLPLDSLSLLDEAFVIFGGQGPVLSKTVPVVAHWPGDNDEGHEGVLAAVRVELDKLIEKWTKDMESK